MRELNVNEIEQVNGGSRVVRALRWLCIELASSGGSIGAPDRSAGWRP
ncbi:MAG: hypothetical protein HWE10_11605 [Gammaproteobacteria bacterium]|nr:hypothetical protein [Gammaproteobacteria bacterium]